MSARKGRDRHNQVLGQIQIRAKQSRSWKRHRRLQGKRSILGASVSLSETDVHWRELLARLQERGLHGARLVASDSHAGLTAVLAARLPGVPWQRCQFHLMQNAMQYVLKVAQRKAVAADLQALFDAPDRAEADRRLQLTVRKQAKSGPRLSACIEADIPQGPTVFTLPLAHRRKRRTTNVLEHNNDEIKRRTRVATLFPNEALALKLVRAVLVEVSDDWETARTYLTMETG